MKHTFARTTNPYEKPDETGINTEEAKKQIKTIVQIEERKATDKRIKILKKRKDKKGIKTKRKKK